jgi:VCBS repeat-containing protein
MTKIATVVAVTGKAFAVDAQGKMREIKAGDEIDKDEVVQTAAGGHVELQMLDGQSIAVLPEHAIKLDDSVTDAELRPTAQDSTLAPTTANTVIQALERGGDLNAELDATAAGATGGAGGQDNAGIVRLLRVSEGVSPLAYDYTFAAPDVVFPTPPAGVPVITQVTTPPTISLSVQVVNPEDGPPEGGLPVQIPPGGGVTTGTVTAVDVVEGSNGNGHAVAFQILLDHPATTDITLTYTLVDGTANYGSDYHDGTPTGTVTILAGNIGIVITEIIVGDNLVEDPETFSIVLSNPAGATLLNDTATVTIVNDDHAPVAVNDIAIMPADAFTVTGNVLTNDTDQDGQTLTVAGGVPLTLTNSDGTLVIQTDGSFVFTPSDATKAAALALDEGQHLDITFAGAYQDTDGANLGNFADVTITINGLNDPPTITVDPGNGNNDGGNPNDVVYEAGLVPNGSGVGPATTLVDGTFTVADPDGLSDIKSVTIDGHVINIGVLGTADPSNVIVGDNGTLTVTGYNSTTGEATYTYQLTSPITDGPGTETNVFTLTTSDGTVDSSPATITIEIVDDTPTAVNDGPAGVVEDGVSSISGNVLSNDLSGADAPAVFTNWSAADAAAIAALNTYGTLTQNASGSWTYVLDNSRAATQALTSSSNLSYDLHYTMQDADGDTSSAKLTITITGANDTQSVTVDAVGGTHTTVYETALANGSNELSNPAPNSDPREVVSGSFSVSATDGIASVSVGGASFTLAQLHDSVYLAAHTINTGQGTLLITGYSSGDGDHTASIGYSYTLTANVLTPPAATTFFDDTGNMVTVTGVSGSTSAAQDLQIRIVDDMPTFTQIDYGIIGHQAGTLLGTDNLIFGADGEGVNGINLAALTSLSGVTYSATVHNLNGSSTITAGTNGSTTGFFTLTVNPDETYAFQLINPSPTVTHTAPFETVSGGAAVPVLTLGTGADAITFTGLGGDTIKPTSAGFGVNDGNLDPGDNFSVSFAGNLVDSVSFAIKQEAAGAFTMTWITNTGESGVASTSVDGTFTINPVSDFSTITFDVTDGKAKVDSFSYSQELLPPTQVLQFNVSGTDGDGDVSATQVLNIELLGGSAGAAIAGTSGNDSILGTSAGESINGGAGNDILTGGLGSDTFVWKLGNTGADKVTDFTLGPVASGGDVLDLKDLLTGEHANAASLDAYLDFSANGSGQTVVSIHPTGSGGVTQSITLENLQYSALQLAAGGGGTDAAIIAKLLTDGNLKTDV